MRKTITRLTCVVMALILLLGAVPASAAEESENPSLDFVLVLDCSYTLALNDPNNLCLAAVRNFVDTLPIQDARVAVVAFGYKDGSSYTYSAGYSVTTGDSARIHQIIPLELVGTPERKASVKDKIYDEVVAKSGDKDSYTPIGHAMAAATDILSRNNCEKESGCIILVTDGVESPVPNGGDAEKQDMKVLDQACQTAKENKWNIYSIHLCYGHIQARPAELSDAKAFLDSISENDGGGKIGRLECRCSEDVYIAFQSLYDDLLYHEPNPPVHLTIPGDYTFEVKEMTSEVTLNVFGAGATSVELTRNGSNQPPIVVTKTEKRGNLLATVEEDYFQVKMLCPEEGKWTAHIDGKSSAQVLVNSVSMTEMGLIANAVQKGTNQPVSGIELAKTDTITVNAQLAYYGVIATNRDFYLEHAKDAELRVENADGSMNSFEMSATKDGFYCDIPLNEIPSGQHEMSVILKYSGFRNGQKASEEIPFRITNIPVLAKDLNGNDVQRTAYVNSNFDRIEISELFENQDNDPLQLELTCTNDRSVQFVYDEEDAKVGYLTIHGVNAEGVFQVEVAARDPDMLIPAVSNITLTVENRVPVISEKIRKQEVRTSNFLFQKDPPLSLELDLNDHFLDPDGLPLTYTWFAADPSVLNLSAEGSGKLTVIPAAEGKSTVTVTASDGIATVSQEFEVTAVTGWTAFWQYNWLWVTLTLLALVLIVGTTLIIVKNKRVKGEWDITFDDGADFDTLENINIRAMTSYGKKGKFKVGKMLAEITPYFNNSGKWALSVPTYFNAYGADAIEFSGVTGKTGCVVSKVPKGDEVNVSNNGVRITSKTKVTGGDLVFIIQDPNNTGAALTVTMKLH